MCDVTCRTGSPTALAHHGDHEEVGGVMPPLLGEHDRRCRLPCLDTTVRMPIGAFRRGLPRHSQRQLSGNDICVLLKLNRVKFPAAAERIEDGDPAPVPNVLKMVGLIRAPKALRFDDDRTSSASTLRWIE